ncbi:MAG: PQQ-dependent sugar dehydrogenase [Nitrospirales bacterium]|nr:PQQ-dependent sugar dehydrogenase [Nitrospirales bacterium]MBA3964483.1 PQQ-dependent sugar dehydrogenase [Nitrospirales bacterium]
MAVGLWSTSGWSLSGKPAPVNGPIGLQLVVEHDFSKPVFLTGSPDQTKRLFVVEQDGRIVILNPGQGNPSLFLDIAEKLSTGGERGLLGLAFHPQYSTNGRFFVNYTRTRDGATVIAEYHVSSDPDRADPQETIRLVIPQPYSNHNGGMIAFGHDALLYIGMGDGGAGGDPENRAQDRKSLLGKFLRIDVDGPPPYRIPADNPFVGQQGQPEIFALGLRNPWRFSFDRQTGELWAGDVGQNLWEEIDVIAKGKDYGWRLLEGTHCFNPVNNCELAQHVVPPVTEYRHEQGRCSVTGGYVYRGKRMPSLEGVYVFGDYCTGEIWGYRNGQTTQLLDTDLQIASFGEDRGGEIYVIGHQGKIFQIVPNSPSAVP